MLTRPLILATSTALLLACSQPRPASDAVTEATARTELDAFWKKHEQIVKRGDVAAYSALHTDSATYAITGVPTLRGRAAIEAFVADFFKTTKYSQADVTPEQRWIHGSHAYEFGAYHEVYQSAGKKPQEDYGRYAIAFVRDDQEGWRIARLVAFVDSSVTR